MDKNDAKRKNLPNQNQILEAAGISFEQFAGNLAVIFNKLNVDQDMNDRLKVMKDTAWRLKHIFNKSQKLWSRCLAWSMSDKFPGGPINLNAEEVARLKNLAWLILLLTNPISSWSSPDLAALFHSALVSTAWVLSLCCAKGAGDVLTQQQVFERILTQEELYNNEALVLPTSDVAMASLKLKKFLESATKGVTPLLLRDASKGMRSVVSADLCMTSIERMKQQYAATRLCSVFDVDARMFLDDLSSPVTPTKQRPDESVRLDARASLQASACADASWNPDGSRVPYTASSASTFVSPKAVRRLTSEETQCPTPVTLAQQAFSWGERMGEVTLKQVQLQLQETFEAQAPETAPALMQLVTDSVAKYSSRLQLPSSSPGARWDATEESAGSDRASTVLERCKALAVKVYYRTLRSMAVCERKRLFEIFMPTAASAQLHKWLSSARFHAILLACSFEVALRLRNFVTLTVFPKLLTLFEIGAFDYLKVIESFVRHQEHFPSLLKRHLSATEEKIIESTVWQPKHAPESLYQRNCRSKAVEIFLRKLRRVAAARINDFCRTFFPILTQKIMDQIWTAVNWCIQNARGLFRNRHIDCILLCTIYAVCKVNELPHEVKFKHVIAHYKRKVFRKNQVIHNILLRSPDIRGDIIQFYNQVFVNQMKNIILQFKPFSSRARSLSANFDSSKDQFASPTKIIPLPQPPDAVARVPKSNVFLSPQRPRRTMMTPRTRALYAFGERLNSGSLELINGALNRGTPLSKDLEFLSSDVTESGDPTNFTSLLRAHFDDHGEGDGVFLPPKKRRRRPGIRTKSNTQKNIDH